MPLLAPKTALVPRAQSRSITPADVLVHLRPRLDQDLTIAQLAQAYLDAAELEGRDLASFRTPIRLHNLDWPSLCEAVLKLEI